MLLHLLQEDQQETVETQIPLMLIQMHLSKSGCILFKQDICLHWLKCNILIIRMRKIMWQHTLLYGVYQDQGRIQSLQVHGLIQLSRRLGGLSITTKMTPLLHHQEDREETAVTQIQIMLIQMLSNRNGCTQLKQVIYQH